MSESLDTGIIVDQFGKPVLGLTAGQISVGEFAGEEVLVFADYFDPGFSIVKARVFDGFDPFSLGLKFLAHISNENSAGYSGGRSLPLFDKVGSHHSAPRAQVAQISVDGKTLLYLGNGLTNIGRFDLETGEVISPLSGIQGHRGEYFLQLQDGRILVAEDYVKPAPELGLQNGRLGLYVVEGGDLVRESQMDLPSSLLYGLSETTDGKVFLVAPEGSSLSDGVGIYELENFNGESLNGVELVKAYDGISSNARGLIPIEGLGGLEGFLFTTWNQSRKSPVLGQPSMLAYQGIQEEV
ncbi:hypothetical protein CL619_02060 [archaeon]|nr:hypothetical protein [archaeon]|tara:strand:- start:460 stop:1350 length:891 start_codon:yes stop_codon:yes gene_type:complete